jgi:lipopolysaccharide biosynthesis regulator YciM
MSPANDNAYTRYLKVLELDPSDVRARQGMREIARRYLTLAQSASRDGDVDRARTFLERAKRADPESPRIAEIEGLIGR